MLHLRSKLAGIALAGATLLLASPALAAQLVPVPLNVDFATSGTNTLSLRVRLTCSGSLCGLVGFGSAYDQTQTSTLSGSTGSYLDDGANTIRFSSDAAGTTDLLTLTGSNVTFSGIPVLGNVTTTSIAVSANNAPVSGAAGMDLRIPPESPLSSYALSFLGYEIGAAVTTDNGTLPSIDLPPTPIDAIGTLVELGDADLDNKPELAVQDLRGAFSVTSSTAISGVTINAQFWATFTLNLIGESVQQIPEPASFLLVGGGLLGFGIAASRRRRAEQR